MKSRIFLRGQVWFWTDPIFGNKKDNNEITKGEIGLRYSRYVVILQDEVNAIGTLVVPLSSQNHTANDVEVPLMIGPQFRESVSYAKCRSIFPVAVCQLKQYICTLPEEKMKEIEGEIIKLMVPRILDHPATKSAVEILDIPLSSDPVISMLPTTSVTENGITVTVKSVTAVDPDPVKVPDENDIGNVLDTRKHPIDKKWTDESKKEFLKMYTTDGKEATCKKFEIAPSSAYRYFTEWRKEFDLGSLNAETTEPAEPVEAEAVDDIEYDVEVIENSISRFSNNVRDYVGIGGDLYFYYLENEYNEKKHYSQDAFYSKLTSIMYHSFMDYMVIDRYADDTLVWNGDDGECMEMAFFFMKISDDGMLTSENHPKEIMTEFRKRYNRDGLNTKWGELLLDKLKRTINVSRDGALIIYGEICDALLITR